MTNLITLADFADYTAFSTNIAPALVEPYIRDAQQFDVWPLLPGDLRAELATDRAQWSPATTTLFTEHIRPLLVLGVATAGVLGNNQQIVNLISFFNLRIAPDRALITGPLSKLRPDLDFTVKPLNPVQYIDPELVKVLTPNEIRALGGYAPEAEPTAPTPTPRS